jgi:fibronectin type 3 domain-containing protein
MLTSHRTSLRPIITSICCATALAVASVAPVFAHGGKEPHIDATSTPVVEGASGSVGPIGERIHLPIVTQDGVPSGVVDMSDATAHAREDAVTLDPETEARLSANMRPGNGVRLPVAGERIAANNHVAGAWSAVQPWPIIAIHASVLPNGQVLAYDSVGNAPTESYTVHTTTRAALWNPLTNAIRRVDVDTGYNLFCSGLAHLPDGNIYFAGGNLNNALQGLNKTHTFNFTTNTWARGPDMTQGGRWYPSVTPLANGEMLITEGGPDIPEVRQTNGTLRTLSGASLGIALYPWLQPAPNGTVTLLGPDSNMRSLTTSGTGSWSSTVSRDGSYRDYGSYSAFDIGKVLVSGGGGGASQRTATIVDLTGTAPQGQATASMAFARRQHNLTVLADGTVLATGGLSSTASLVDLNASVYAAELWDPATGRWTTLSNMQVTRQYHSIALLLLDGRVLSAGGGICGTCNTVGYLANNAEVFSPPYLFRRDGSGTLAPRPEIQNAPSTVAFAQPFSINSPQADSIRKVSMVRLSSATHSVNMEQRYVPLTFTRTGTQLNITAPANANIAPPGMYMLFIIDSDGVPSVASVVSLQAPAGNAPAAPTLLTLLPGNGSAQLTWTAVAGATGYVIRYGASSGVYTGTQTVGAVTNATLTGLTNNTPVYVVINTTNANGSSGNSNERSVTPAEVGGGLNGSYYNNRTLSGAPVLQRVEAVNFDFGSGAPAVGMNADSFSVRWEGTVVANVSGAYQFQTESDDGVRLFVNNTQVINNWTDHGPTLDTSAPINLVAGIRYAIRLEYYENTGGALIKLRWKEASQGPFSIVPVTSLFTGSPTPPPAAPTLNSATPGNASVALSWSSVSGATRYTVRYGTASNTLTNTVDAGSATSANISGLSNGVTYFFAVSASNAVGASPNSNQLTATPVAPSQPPAAPTLDYAVAGNTKATLTWSPVANATSYAINYGTSSGSYPNTVNAGAATQFDVNGLTNGVAYYFVVVASNSAGSSPRSNELSATPAAPPPAAPTLNSAIPGNGNVTLSWTAVSGASGYTIRYGTSPGSYPTTLNAGSATTFDVNGLNNGTAYYFVVTASSASGVSANSNERSATPSAGTGARLVIYDEALASDWQDWSWETTVNFANSAPVRAGERSIAATYRSPWVEFKLHHARYLGVSTTGYTRLRFWVNGGVAGNQTLRLSVNSDDTFNVTFSPAANQWSQIEIPLSDLGNPSQLYEIRITDPSGAVPGTFYIDDLELTDGGSQAPQAPAAPVLNSASAGDGLVNLSWSPTVRATSYLVKYRVGASAWSIPLNVGNVASTQVGGLINGTAYTFAVIARNATGDSPDSNTLNATPAAPTGAVLVLFDEALGTGWLDWSFGTARNFAATSPVKTGTRSLAVTYQESLVDLKLRYQSIAGVSSGPYRALRFWVHGGVSGGQRIRVGVNTNYGAVYDFTAVANQWTLIEIPLSTFGSPASIYELRFTENSYGPQPEFYLDEIALQ